MVPTRVNPYSVIDITPFQEDQPPPPPSPDANAEEEGAGLRVPSGYSVPVPCGYAVPSNLPLLLPAYSSPVVIRAESVEEEGRPPRSPPHSGRAQGLRHPCMSGLSFFPFLSCLSAVLENEPRLTPGVTVWVQ